MNPTAAAPGFLDLAFTAGTAGSAPMTWGQLAIWRPIVAFGEGSAFLNVTRVLAVPGGGLPEEPVAAALRRVIEREQSLRTRFHPGPGAPRQEVHAEGSYRIAVLEVPDPRQVPQAAAEQAGLLAARAFDLEREWPVRWCLIRAGGRIRAVSLAASHAAMDGWGAKLLLGALQAAFEGGPQRGPEVWQPLDQAALEASPRGRRQNDKALAYWRTGLAGLPASARPDPPGHPAARPRFQKWALTSTALAAASLAVARRTRTSSSAVLLTLGALYLARLRGVDKVPLLLIAGNRFTPRMQQLLAAAADNGLFVFEDDKETFDEAVAAVYRQATEAYYFAQYDPDALTALRQELAAQRGPVDLTAYFNDSRLGEEWDLPAGTDDPPALRALPAADEPVCVEEYDEHDMSYYLTVAQRDADCQVFLMADTRLIPPAGIRTLLRELESVLRRAAEGDLALAEILLPAGIRATGTGMTSDSTNKEH